MPSGHNGAPALTGGFHLAFGALPLLLALASAAAVLRPPGRRGGPPAAERPSSPRPIAQPKEQAR